MLKRSYPKGMKRSLVKNILKGNVVYNRGLFYKATMKGHTSLVCLSSWFEYVMLRNAHIRELDLQNEIVQLSRSDVFLDVGANIGLYSLLASFYEDKVYAIEPHFNSFSSLCKNITINNLNTKITAMNIALSDCNEIIDFNVLFTDASASGGQVNDNHRFGEAFTPELVYKCSAYTLDYLVSSGVIAFPTIVKIDVDGLESKILNGAQTILKDIRLKRIIVEFDTLQDADLEISKLKKFGFKLDSTHLISKDGSGCKNYHFVRE